MSLRSPSNGSRPWTRRCTASKWRPNSATFREVALSHRRSAAKRRSESVSKSPDTLRTGHPHNDLCALTTELVRSQAFKRLGLGVLELFKKGGSADFSIG